MDSAYNVFIRNSEKIWSTNSQTTNWNIQNTFWGCRFGENINSVLRKLSEYDFSVTYDDNLCIGLDNPYYSFGGVCYHNISLYFNPKPDCRFHLIRMETDIVRYHDKKYNSSNEGDWLMSFCNMVEKYPFEHTSSQYGEFYSYTYGGMTIRIEIVPKKIIEKDIIAEVRVAYQDNRISDDYITKGFIHRYSDI